MLSHFLLGISFAVPMGPVNLEIVRRGIGQGFLSAWIVSLGAITADVVYLIAIDRGISMWLSIQWIHVTLTWLGALFFLKLGYSSIKSTFHPSENLIIQIAAYESSRWNAFWSGFLIAIMNPISFLFWSGVYGSLYVTLLQKHDSNMIIMCIGFLFLGKVIWNINVATTVHVSRRYLHEKGVRVITFITGLVLIGFGIKFFWEGISYFLKPLSF
ncbi:LysE family translocator [Shimazuella soli]|uniref:LysE family translocator n=1 Tax=Shimazuella soli TaxID=1892854 RepID=UPI001F0D4BA6|nr:LysE family translocator [Shimazuella soli]